MLNRTRKTAHIGIKKVTAVKPRLWMSTHPYRDTKIRSIDTGLKKQWKYSPLFSQPIVDTYVTLTGSRKKDYTLAEAKSNVRHTPKMNVWHHVWEKNQNGEFRMQLVDFDLHKKSCPHAGGCKLWSIENGKTYKSQGNVYVGNHLRGQVYRGKKVWKVGDIRVGQEDGPYGDFVIDYIFAEELDNSGQKIHRFRSAFQSKKRFRLWGLDPYGNVFYSDMKRNLYFYDHETGKLINIGVNESEIIK